MCRNVQALKLGMCCIIAENRRSDKRGRENDCEFSQVKLRLESRQKEWRSRGVVIRERRCFNKSRRLGLSGWSTGSCKIYICAVWKGAGILYLGVIKTFLMLFYTSLILHTASLTQGQAKSAPCRVIFHAEYYPWTNWGSNKEMIGSIWHISVFLSVSISIEELILLRRWRRIYFNFFFFLEAYCRTDASWRLSSTPWVAMIWNSLSDVLDPD